MIGFSILLPDPNGSGKPAGALVLDVFLGRSEVVTCRLLSPSVDISASRIGE
jgi:hypothetical protein